MSSQLFSFSALIDVFRQVQFVLFFGGCYCRVASFMSVNADLTVLEYCGSSLSF